MKDQQKFQNTFSHLHADPDILTEVLNMNTENNIKYYRPKKLLTVAIAACLALSLCVSAYAADFCGIRTTIQLWINGEQTEVAVQFDGNGSYTTQYTDKDGVIHEGSGGGIAYEADGTERPLTEEELMTHLDHPDVEYKDDGTVWAYYHDQQIEITDSFDEDGVCYLLLEDGNETLYMTVKYQNGFGVSPDGYMTPEEFN